MYGKRCKCTVFHFIFSQIECVVRDMDHLQLRLSIRPVQEQHGKVQAAWEVRAVKVVEEEHSHAFRHSTGCC